jgi:hypothetical protein
MSFTPHDLESETPSRVPTRRRLIFAAIIILILLALIFTPPLLNVGRLRHRITTSMSQSLGRPVHLDGVTFHLLPMPGFTLTNLVVSEDPAFGNEPVIRAMDVEATLRVSSLWRRQVEFSTIRFVPDANGSAPSINIVRNAQGRWNLQEILSQASHANTAPTAQRKAGPTPRFPYIEATGARINLKLGDEKMPYSLTDADFALWLPSPQQWHIRLKAKPVRTDTNASDTGEVQLEGTLGRAAQLAAIPINLTASWAHAQMGEATRLLTGDDQSWRGTVDAGATLTGQLGSANLTTDIHLTELRRADFFPEKLLDISTHCTAAADVTQLTLTNATCTIPSDSPQPITLSSTTLDLQSPSTADVTFDVHQVPLNWAFDWARLFTPHIPSALNPIGTIDGQLTRPAGPTASWKGNLQATLQSVTTGNRHLDLSTKPVLFDWQATPNPFNLQLQPVPIRLSPTSQLTLTATVDPHGYAFQLSGSAKPSQITALAADTLPPLGNQLLSLLKFTTEEEQLNIALKCSRPFDTQQTCTTLHPEPPTKPKHHHR